MGIAQNSHPRGQTPQTSSTCTPLIAESGPALMRTPKGMRMAIGLFGRRNVGKSSVLNAITNQQTSIVSAVAGTTADPVDKPMELLPLGPVLFIDTAGIDDDQETIGELRAQRTKKVFDRCDMGVIVTEAGIWGPYEEEIAAQLSSRSVPFIIVCNKTDLLPTNARDPESDPPDPAEIRTPRGTVIDFQQEALTAACRRALPHSLQQKPLVCMCAAKQEGVLELRQALLDNAPEEFVNDPKIIGDIVEPGSVVILVIPIDKEAPKGRLILPQVQAIRDLLGSRCLSLCVTDKELPRALAALAAIVPENVPLTGFSVAFARFKGDLPTQALGTLAIGELTENSRVLIAEACTHHPIEEDIGTVKIPRLLRARIGQGLTIENVRGVDFPEDLSSYDLVIHCGGCTFNRRAVLSRIQACVHAGVPVSNYGLTLAYLMGVIDRSIKAFPGMEQFLEENQH